MKKYFKNLLKNFNLEDSCSSTSVLALLDHVFSRFMHSSFFDFDKSMVIILKWYKRQGTYWLFIENCGNPHLQL